MNDLDVDGKGTLGYINGLIFLERYMILMMLKKFMKIMSVWLWIWLKSILNIKILLN